MRRTMTACPTDSAQCDVGDRNFHLSDLEYRQVVTALHELSIQLSRAGSFSELCRQAVLLGTEVLGFDRMGLWFRVGDTMDVTGSYGIDEEGCIRDERDCRLHCQQSSTMGKVLAGGEPSALVEETQLLNHRGRAVGVGHQAIASLWNGERIIGCLCADNLKSHAGMGEEHREILQLYAVTLGHLCTYRLSQDELALALERQRMLRDIIDRGPAMAFRWRAVKGFPVEFASDNVSQLGYTAGDFTSGHINWVGITHPDDNPRLQREVEYRLSAGHKEWSRRYRLRTADGEYRWFEDRNRVVTDATGSVTHIEGVVLDVTDRRQMDERLLQVVREEQRNIGEMLHDSLGQELTGLAYLARALQRSVTDGGPEAPSLAAQLSALATNAVNHARTIAKGLSPVAVVAGGLAEALRELAQATADIYGVSCRCEVMGTGLVHDDDVASNLYCIAKEAVTNAVRHAEPTTIAISLTTSPDEGSLSVQDDGCGFSATATSNGLGLRIMQHRADILGGSLAVSSEPGQGTVVRCVFSP